ncbi:uncharacterized protein LOC128953214 [Oppia nitens]|uniref:uncharacterized protein LOC128953214 n=1 Tax=Oppia nitens TaxID=1686743 RepID=UPI0023DC299B|nr:uncharacterized protein LOC128953214 [Oppia nitens]
MWKNQLATILIVVFTMQFSMSYQDTKPIKFDLVAMNKRNGFNDIVKKNKPGLESTGKMFTQFFDRFGKVPADDLMFAIRDDFAEIIRDLGDDADVFQKRFAQKAPAVSAAMKLVSQLFKQIGQTIHQTIQPLLAGKQRQGKPLLDKHFGPVTYKLSDSVGKQLTAEEAPKQVGTVFVELLQLIGRASNQAIQSVLGSTKVAGIIPAQYLPIQTFSKTLQTLIDKIIDICKNVLK